MRRIQRFILLLMIFMVVVAGASVMQAADFQWFPTCQFRDDGQQLHYWVGYTSASDLPESYLGYIGNGPGIAMDTPLAGTDDHAVDVLLPTDDSTVQLFLYPDDISITITSDTAAPDCGAPVAVNMATITLPVDSGSLFRWQKRDPYGHWGDVAGVVTPVQDENGQRFTRLVLGSDNPDHNPNDYQVTAVG